MDSKNWHRDEVSMRGRLPEQLGSIAALLIGVGALGSVLAELLVRGGVHQLLILDHDTLEAGNLARHTLGLDDVDRPKAKAVAERLNRASPHASVRYLCSRFPFVDDVGAAQVRDCDLVIDTTGSDEVLAHSERFEWGARKTFFSASIGLNAARLFCFTAVGTGFPHSKFRQLVNPWLEKDIQEAGGRELPREGIGCWHPVFPARVDDVWMMAGVVVKDLERSLATPPPGALLRVYGQEHEQGVFRGLRLLEEKHFSLH
jgi:threonine dehydrogenase-like Zn-dependent dehydrogenase